MEFKCKDVGFEECRWTTTGNIEQEILQKCAVHAQKDHGMKPEEITEELRNKIRASLSALSGEEKSGTRIFIIGFFLAFSIVFFISPSGGSAFIDFLKNESAITAFHAQLLNEKNVPSNNSR